MDIQQNSNILIEQLNQKMGIVVVCGTRFGNLDQYIENYLGQLKNKKISYFSQPKIDEDTDIVVLDSPINAGVLDAVLDFCDEGRVVLLKISAPSVEGALHKILGFCEGEGRKHKVWRMLEHLSFVLNYSEIPSLTKEKFPIYEFLMVTPAIKKIISNDNMDSIYEMMIETEEKMGVFTLNQSLLHGLLKRKIDLKTAFEWSRNPEDLDLLLKRVGV